MRKKKMKWNGIRGRDVQLTQPHWQEVSEKEKGSSGIIRLLDGFCSLDYRGLLSKMWKRDGSFSASGTAISPKRKTLGLFHLFIISSHFVCMSLMEFCPVQSCLLEAKHSGLDSVLWHLQLPMTKGISKETEFVFHLWKKWKWTVKHLIFEKWNNGLCSSWSSVRFIVYFQYHWDYRTVQEGPFTCYTPSITGDLTQ